MTQVMESSPTQELQRHVTGRLSFSLQVQHTPMPLPTADQSQDLQWMPESEIIPNLQTQLTVEQWG